MSNRDELDDFLDGPLTLGDDGALDDSAVERTLRELGPDPDEVALDDLVDAYKADPVAEDDEDEEDDLAWAETPTVSFLSPRGSSLRKLTESAVTMQSLLRSGSPHSPEAHVADMLTKIDTQNPSTSLLDLMTVESKEALAAVMGADLYELQGGEVTIIVHPKTKPKPELTQGQRLALHFNSMPIDGVAFIGTTQPTLQILRQLRRMRLQEGIDFEFLGPENLTEYEHRAMRELMRGANKTIRILRRLSRTKANVLGGG